MVIIIEREKHRTCLYSNKETDERRKLGQVRAERSPEKEARVAMKERRESFWWAGGSTDDEEPSSECLLSLSLLMVCVCVLMEERVVMRGRGKRDVKCDLWCSAMSKASGEVAGR